MPASRNNSFLSGPTLVPHALPPGMTLIPSGTPETGIEPEVLWPDLPQEHRPTLAARALRLVLINVILCSIAAIGIVALATSL